jgi:hypothetical protein
MRCFLILILLCVSLGSFSQQRSFYGRVLDHRLNGIPFAVVEAKDRHEGVYTDENGIFSFRANSDTIKTLVFSCMGYDTKEVDVAEMPRDSIIIALKQKVNQLKEVQIVPGKDQLRTLGRKKPKHIGDCYRSYGAETAIFLKPESNKSGFLKDILVFITNEGAYNTKFRMHVYEWDSISNLPGRELTDSNLIMQASHGNEWVKADVSSKVIPCRWWDLYFHRVDLGAGQYPGKPQVEQAQRGDKLQRPGAGTYHGLWL